MRLPPRQCPQIFQEACELSGRQKGCQLNPTSQFANILDKTAMNPTICERQLQYDILLVNNGLQAFNCPKLKTFQADL
jgi:hypothetical protein